MAVVTTVFMLASSIETFDEAAQHSFRLGLAALLECVRAEDIELDTQSASIRVTTSFQVASVGTAMLAAGVLRSTSAASLSTRLGAPITAVSDSIVAPVLIAAPSPPPPSPPPPLPPPVPPAHPDSIRAASGLDALMPTLFIGGGCAAAAVVLLYLLHIRCTKRAVAKSVGWNAYEDKSSSTTTAVRW